MEEDDETPVAALEREVKEELDLDLHGRDLRFILITPHDLDEGEIHFFEACIDSRRDRVRPRSNEILEVKWLSLADAAKLPVLPATARFIERLQREHGCTSHRR
jgi:8-oxo-dGTP pyrophosphatase MutT (NUDIX family)